MPRPVALPSPMLGLQVVSGYAGEENDTSFPFLKVWKGSPQTETTENNEHKNCKNTRSGPRYQFPSYQETESFSCLSNRDLVQEAWGPEVFMGLPARAPDT
ncbi:Neuron Navigator 1 [Manis pentadactyla]|nr:Neuron Navigator 1 [Manis pentadactyla]